MMKHITFWDLTFKECTALFYYMDYYNMFIYINFSNNRFSFIVSTAK